MNEESDHSAGSLSLPEVKTWEAIWKFYTYLPTRLDAYLRANAGMSHHDFEAISALSRMNSSSVRMSELAETVGMSLSHLSRVISRLEEKNLVIRSPDPVDGRSTRVEVSKAGAQLLERVTPLYVAEIRRVFFSQVSPDQLSAVREVMERSLRALDD